MWAWNQQPFMAGSPPGTRESFAIVLPAFDDMVAGDPDATLSESMTA